MIRSRKKLFLLALIFIFIINCYFLYNFNQKQQHLIKKQIEEVSVHINIVAGLSNSKAINDESFIVSNQHIHSFNTEVLNLAVTNQFIFANKIPIDLIVKKDASYLQRNQKGFERIGFLLEDITTQKYISKKDLTYLLSKIDELIGDID